jgi:hypothetical protein
MQFQIIIECYIPIDLQSLSSPPWTTVGRANATKTVTNEASLWNNFMADLILYLVSMLQRRLRFVRKSNL